MFEHLIAAGDIIAAHYGYDAHYTEFYKVKKRTPMQVFLVRLLDERSNYNERGDLGWDVVPTDEERGTVIRRKVRHCTSFDTHSGERRIVEYVNIEDWERGYVWDGEPVHNFDWH